LPKANGLKNFSVLKIRSKVDTVHHVFHLEAGRLEFLDGVKNELSTLDSFFQLVVTVKAKPSKSLKFTILSRKSFVMSKEFKWKVQFQISD